ncbi:protein asteroid homolog 1 isoform X2 [Rhea pennata]|uniref:protein asteroid homolog 1 isoform X2 n=1 Tax=Rhea pennata TaxID=8795 RepID=UPI002E2576C3
MGVPGLTGFVEEHGGFLAALRVRRTKLVIDGSSLYHRLFFTCGADVRRGGDYGPFAAAVGAFFGSLRACGVAPCVVLDGGRDAADGKLATLRGRAAERLRAAHGLCRPGGGGGGGLLPLLAREAFVQALRRLGVPLAQCFAEADREIAALANRWGCPVLTLDSDFCIFDLRAGYCPLSHFQWQSVCSGDDALGCYIPARCFSSEKFCSHFGQLNKTLLPLFAVMNGNDYVNLPALEIFFSKVQLPAGCCGWRGRKHARIQGLLNWLSRFAEPAEAIENVLKYLKKHQREEVRELLHTSMEGYLPSDVNLEDFFQHGKYESQAATKSDLPQWVLDALAKGELSPFISDALILRSTFLHVQVENMQRSSAHSTALPIRQVIYGLLLKIPHTTEAASPSKQINKLPVVCEFDRIQKTLKKTFVQAASLPTDFCDDHFPLDKLMEVPMSCRLMLLLETLGVKMSILESVPSHLQLPVAVTCYWIRSSEPKVKLHQLKALLLMLIFGEWHSTTDDPVLCFKDGSKKEKKLQNTDFDLEAAHSFCQWQCCLQMGFYLNQLLSSPLPEPDLTRLYSGTLVHRLCQELKSAPSAENVLSPEMTEFYQDLLNTVKSTVPPDFFQKKTKTRPESCKKKKSCSKTKASRCAILETQPLCDVNRFASLKVDD